MHPWRHESIFADYIAEHSLIPSKNLMNTASSPITQEARSEHLRIISDIHASLQRLQPYLNRQDQEYKWVDQLRTYMERLRASNSAQTITEQFSQLYALRKWLFWVPISLLAAKRGDVTVLVVLGHFYATALALEPLFRDIGSVFCANLALQPLEEIIHVVQGYQDARYDQRTQSISYLIQFPADMVSSYKTRRDWIRQQAGQHSPVQPAPYGLETLNLELESQIAQYSYGQSLSPAFAPSPLTFIPSGITSGQTSPYLEVPPTPISTYSSTTYASPSTSYAPIPATYTHVPTSYISASTSYASPLGSPATVPPSYPVSEEHGFSFGMPLGYHPSGFVATPIWT
jgi:hypothetical protein